MIRVGDYVMYGGRAHVLVGVTPAGVTPFAVQLEDPATDEVFWVEAALRQYDGSVHVTADELMLRE